jgi:uncharacterized membrane protein (UPF0127 family)
MLKEVAKKIKSARKKYLTTVVLVGLAVTAALVVFLDTDIGNMYVSGVFDPEPCYVERVYRADTKLNIEDVVFFVEVAQTDASRAKGLSGRPCITDDVALLFVFNESDLHGFWMKDMNFDIDIIWLDTEKKIIDVWKNASPRSYPEIRKPVSPAKYVLEVKAGTFEALSLNNGLQLSW